MIATEFTEIFSVEVLTATCEDLADPALADRCAATGGEQHSYALVLLGLFALAMAWGTSLGRSRPAAMALTAVGVAVLAIAVVGDVPDTTRAGEIGLNFSEAEVNPRIGLWLELVGGGLALLAGTLRLIRPGREPPEAR
jgi:hypothetical protein